MVRKYIRITGAKKGTYWYADKIGEVFEVVERSKFDGFHKYHVAYRGTGYKYLVDAEDCEIIKEGEDMTKSTGIIEQMQSEINELKAKVEELEGKAFVTNLTFNNNGVDINEVARKLIAKVNEYKPTVLKRKSNQQLRDEIVERAKADVNNLKDGRYYRVESDTIFTRFDCLADFVVNSEKRTVVAILKGAGSGRVRAKGIAKCTPTDCFNVHIGKAIALRRALGLYVPSEYYNAPQPEEVRVGDVVLRRGEHSEANGLRTITAVVEKEDSGRRFYHTLERFGTTRDSNIVRIIDDSREERGKL